MQAIKTKFDQSAPKSDNHRQSGLKWHTRDDSETIVTLSTKKQNALNKKQRALRKGRRDKWQSI